MSDEFRIYIGIFDDGTDDPRDINEYHPCLVITDEDIDTYHMEWFDDAFPFQRVARQGNDFLVRVDLDLFYQSDCSVGGIGIKVAEVVFFEVLKKATLHINVCGLDHLSSVLLFDITVPDVHYVSRIEVPFSQMENVFSLKELDLSEEVPPEDSDDCVEEYDVRGFWRA